MPNPYEYILTDVFADRIFGGNQLAVFPFARDFSDVSMAAISREFKLNETVFVTGEVPGGFTLRIFSPHGELPFAGHPLVGAASVLSSRLSDRDCARSFELHVPAGTVPVERVQNGGQPLFMIESPQLPCRLDQEIPISELASLLGLRENQISQSPDKAQAFSAGIPFFCIPLVDQRAVRQAKIAEKYWHRLLESAEAPHVYVFARDCKGEIHARMFAPGVGIQEDPATGAAAVSLGGYLASCLNMPDGYATYIIHQGVDMGRPSRIHLKIECSKGLLKSVKLGGTCVQYAQGTLSSDAVRFPTNKH